MVASVPVLIQKLHVVLQRSLVEARNLALSRNCQQLYDLADTFEIVPTLLNRWQDANLEVVQRSIGHYQSKYPGTAYDYLAILDMDEQEFQAIFRLND
ncbi:MAG: hypothetical protein JNM56_10810 [Planctomycetia bacterium]|nr:hypothetical protein [Planctomycetia bacterium]